MELEVLTVEKYLLLFRLILLIIFANSLDPDQAVHKKVGLDLDPKFLKTMNF